MKEYLIIVVDTEGNPYEFKCEEDEPLYLEYKPDGAITVFGNGILVAAFAIGEWGKAYYSHVENK
jgi:hypothetical protein